MERFFVARKVDMEAQNSVHCVFAEEKLRNMSRSDSFSNQRGQTQTILKQMEDYHVLTELLVAP